MKLKALSWCLAILLLAAGWALMAADAPPPKAGKKQNARQAAKAARAALPSPIDGRWTLVDAKLHRDFPAACQDAQGTWWVSYIEHDGTADTLRLARKLPDQLAPLVSMSEPGVIQPTVIHQPAIACDGSGGIWCFWGQVSELDVMTLKARRFSGIKADKEITLAASQGGETFADAKTDHMGRVWVTWQSFRRGQGDIFARWFDPKIDKWSPEMKISKPEAGNWEPRLAFDGKDGAWIVYDSSRGGEFNVYLARVGLDGTTAEHKITTSAEYEARASIAASPDGKKLWIAAERGRLRWGRPLRGHEPDDGLNGRKRLLVGYFDIDSARFTEIPVPNEGKPSPAPQPGIAVNLPILAVDATGKPWMAWRYYLQNRWSISLTQYDPRTSAWAQPLDIPDSYFGQDRRGVLSRDNSGAMWLCWPSDKRDTKACGVAGVYLASLKNVFTPMENAKASIAMLPEPVPYLNAPTPARPRDQHHTWTVRGKTYTLVYGDLHRHTDFSNCRTGTDGCVLEHFRYAYDMAALDFMGTSDHTDIAKIYDPYEWWQTQRAVDVFYAPGKFNSLYAYEREQHQPWGHRNVVFAHRGGPIIYINRKNHDASPWALKYPVKPGDEPQLTPRDLWEALSRYPKPVAIISHTGATSMGTDWDKYDRIDHALENTVEIFQGARVSYEGLGAPQPTVGLLANEPYTPANKIAVGFPLPPDPIADFTIAGKNYNTGVYQRALHNGLKLGVFASSDHISQHTSFGGVYVEKLTREGIIEGFRARRSIAATDKIFVDFTCDNEPMGSIIESAGNPTLALAVDGTAKISRVTIVRNEENYKIFEPGDLKFDTTFTDPSPVAGENRYYLRVEQIDGNMAWSSPIWVACKRGAVSAVK